MAINNKTVHAYLAWQEGNNWAVKCDINWYHTTPHTSSFSLCFTVDNFPIKMHYKACLQLYSFCWKNENFDSYNNALIFQLNLLYLVSVQLFHFFIQGLSSSLNWSFMIIVLLVVVASVPEFYFSETSHTCFN